VVVDDLAVLTRPGAESRRGEVASVAQVVRSLGLRTAEVTEPATIDGGDVLQVGLARVRRPGRTDQRRGQSSSSGRCLEPLGRTVVGVPVTGCLHLKTGATALPDGTVVAVTGWLDTSAFTDAGLTVARGTRERRRGPAAQRLARRRVGGGTRDGGPGPLARVRGASGRDRRAGEGGVRGHLLSVLVPGRVAERRTEPHDGAPAPCPTVGWRRPCRRPWER
jgi:hypothetical protein